MRSRCCHSLPNTCKVPNLSSRIVSLTARLLACTPIEIFFMQLCQQNLPPFIEQFLARGIPQRSLLSEAMVAVLDGCIVNLERGCREIGAQPAEQAEDKREQEDKLSHSILAVLLFDFLVF